MRKTGLPPVVDANTEILILGTLPSELSIAAGQYYANPANDFWRLVASALNQPFVGLLYEAKTKLLKAHRIGLWDAYHSCIRPGSLDRNITDRKLNDFECLKDIAPRLLLVCFNGREAAKAENALTRLSYRTVLLPSSSGANRRSQIERERRWREAFQTIAT